MSATPLRAVTTLLVLIGTAFCPTTAQTNDLRLDVQDVLVDPDSVLVLSEEVFSAAYAVQDALCADEDGRQTCERLPQLVSACLTRGATTPSYKLVFRGMRPVCVSRPWRVGTWMFDIDSERADCECDA